MPSRANLVHQSSTSTGTGNFDLSREPGKQTFSEAFSTGSATDVFDYFICHRTANEWERGTGHMSNAATLVRDSVLESSNADAAVDFSEGVKDVANDVPADKQAMLDTALTFTATQTFPAAGIVVGQSTPFSDAAGVLTLQHVDALDATTEETVEQAIDALPNLATIQGHTVTLTGDLIRSGAHSLTFTTTGATNVTLPTTGTLATLASPAFTGTPTAPTADPGTDTTQIATTAFARAEIAALVDSAPSTLDTLNELAAALGDDPNFATTVTTSLAGKQPLDSDLTAIAALTTTSFGRGFLAYADEAAFKADVNLEAGTDFYSISATDAAIEVAKSREVTGASATLQLTDRGGVIYMNSGSVQTLTIPANASVAFDVNSVVNVIAEGAGTVTVTGDTGVTLNGISGGSGDIQTQYQGVSLIKKATDTWIASGNIGTVS